MNEYEQMQQQADELVRRFLAELDACTNEEQRIAKVMELVRGIILSARKQVSA